MPLKNIRLLVRASCPAGVMMMQSTNVRVCSAAIRTKNEQAGGDGVYVCA